MHSSHAGGVLLQDAWSLYSCPFQNSLASPAKEMLLEQRTEVLSGSTCKIAESFSNPEPGHLSGCGAPQMLRAILQLVAASPCTWFVDVLHDQVPLVATQILHHYPYRGTRVCAAACGALEAAPCETCRPFQTSRRIMSLDLPAQHTWLSTTGA